MSAVDGRLREAALQWAAAYRAKQAAASAKRKAAEAARHAGFWTSERDRVRRADEQLGAARAALRAATKDLLAVIDPKPLTIRVRARVVPVAQIEIGSRP
ncbi:MAG: hypothetical protein J7605_17240 [Variovorax sp.]|nr:hypothetical protein [Variovorax sp.]